MTGVFLGANHSYEGGKVAHLDQYLLGEHPPQPHPGRLSLPG